ncbi:SDR family oxidoreductase [Bacillus infantis]|uniref:SDR family oxidoreductase n=2 Tax=Bacillus infantis TaxID=324767 RepID=A0A5D4RE55_9BACI|nr:SDR family oxidoreductase [Bacillus infantis]TYS47752.1 SDR family oxidoreductase [Bacillus infantis]
MNGKKNAIVTGASRGFGLLISIELAKRGYSVTAAMRDMSSSAELLKQAEKAGAEDKITLHELDVASEESILRFRTCLKRLGSVDLLVNNAGFAGAGFAEEVELAEYRSQFETNVFGVFAITQAVLPYMREQKRGRIITISSISGKMGFPGLSPYVASKHAVEGWAESLRLEMKPFNVDVVLIEPGSYNTGIWSTGKKVSSRSLQPDSPYYAYYSQLENYLNKSSEKYGDPAEVAELCGKIAGKKITRLRYPVGKGTALTLKLKDRLGWRNWERLFWRILSNKR